MEFSILFLPRRIILFRKMRMDIMQRIFPFRKEKIKKEKAEMDRVFVKYRRKFISLNYRLRSIRATRVIDNWNYIIVIAGFKCLLERDSKKGKRENFTIRLNVGSIFKKKRKKEEMRWSSWSWNMQGERNKN